MFASRPDPDIGLRYPMAMILFTFPSCGHISRQLRAIPSVRLGQFAITRFENRELYVTLREFVSGQRCLILGSIAPPDEHLLSLLLLAHTLKKEEADKVTAVLPYLAYSRQDKNKPGESLATAWIGSLLKNSGIDDVLTVDVHSERDKGLFPLPLCSLSTAELFAAAIKKHRLANATIVAPDNGAISRCEAVKSAAGMPIGRIPYFEKKRTEKRIIHHHGPVGNLGAKVVIIDDMIDTGGTLVSACEQLRAAKVEEIYIMVSHGLFTGSGWAKLWHLGVRHIFCTDTVRLRAGIETTNITVLSVAPLLREKLSAMERATVKTARG